jgi:hypothetical protein
MKHLPLINKTTKASTVVKYLRDDYSNSFVGQPGRDHIKMEQELYQSVRYTNIEDIKYFISYTQL